MAMIFLNSIHQIIFVMEKHCFLCGTDRILEYLDKLRLPGVSVQHSNPYKSAGLATA
jgi:hypothetical protein